MKKERLNVGRQTNEEGQAVNEKCSKVKEGGSQGAKLGEARGGISRR